MKHNAKIWKNDQSSCKFINSNVKHSEPLCFTFFIRIGEEIKFTGFVYAFIGNLLRFIIYYENSFSARLYETLWTISFEHRNLS